VPSTSSGASTDSFRTRTRPVKVANAGVRREPESDALRVESSSAARSAGRATPVYATPGARVALTTASAATVASPTRAR